MYGGNPYGGKEMEMANMRGHMADNVLSHPGSLVDHKVPVKTCWCTNKMVDPMAQVHSSCNIDIVVSVIPLIMGFVMLFYEEWEGWATTFILFYGLWFMLTIATHISVTTLCGKTAFKIISAIWLVWRTIALVYLFIMCLFAIFYLLWAIFVEVGWTSQLSKAGHLFF